MEQKAKKLITERMEKTLDALKKDLASIRTGRASISVLDGVLVNSYGTPAPLSHVATLSVPESRTITIQPWDVKMIPEIEKAIQKADLGLNPSNDGKIIRLSVPQLTEERRKEIVKTAHKKGEEAKVALRNIRRDGNDEMKKLEKDKHLSEDDTKRSIEDVQKITDSFIKRTDEIIKHKEAEIMEV